jgi:hypothetical protein
MQNYIIIFVVYTLFVIVILMIPANLEFLYADELRDNMREVDSMTYSYMMNKEYAAMSLNVSS